jgi:hypothetical protein
VLSTALHRTDIPAHLWVSVYVLIVEGWSDEEKHSGIAIALLERFLKKEYMDEDIT